jgi:predicted transcriptional regulator
LPAANRRRVREILGPAIRAELAEYMAERATEHVRAA